MCGASSATVLFEQVAGLDERLGEAARPDDNRRTSAMWPVFSAEIPNTFIARAVIVVA